MESVKSIMVSRCEKLRGLRQMTGMSRREFSKKHRISAATLQNWETPRLGGVSEAGARKIIKCYADQGIQVDFSWLMFDSGVGPSLWSEVGRGGGVGKRHDVLRQKDFEVDICTSVKKSQVVFHLQDDGMLPRYHAGDIFIGMAMRSRQKEIGLLGCLCIVSSVDDNLELGYVANIKSRQRAVWLVRLNNSKENRGELISYQHVWPVTTILKAKNI